MDSWRFDLVKKRVKINKKSTKNRKTTPEPVRASLPIGMEREREREKKVKFKKKNSQRQKKRNEGRKKEIEPNPFSQLNKKIDLK